MVEVKTPAPELGEHTREILKEFGFEEKEISELEEKGIIRAIER
jgi:crotonobetainyl-CoA:carnitine CoA-transferase CaiB-like acyl-CoA transferase